MAAVPAGSSASADAAIPKVMHPCYSLSNFNNYKNQLYDIFDYGDFSTTICAKQCAHFVDAARITCGDRRPPPTYLVGSVLGPVRKINCSDWALPLTAKGVKDVSLVFADSAPDLTTIAEIVVKCGVGYANTSEWCLRTWALKH
ncbi:hypothetical protein CAEBREN_16744 [Caenorhabditis brenneri]|uniref:Uncharacterized protein n=1 Tax=Caenorhabditis brenneri TaxID=135651 RepID=G0PJR1_CAEBE|nr:hypothetical protein CAEBREN_16744 [Caenorhabditis brenneri]